MSSSSVTKYYYFGGQRHPKGPRQRNGGTLYYLHQDQLGSTVLTTSGANATEQFRAYGAVRGYSGSNPSRYQFTGRYALKVFSSNGLPNLHCFKMKLQKSGQS